MVKYLFYLRDVLMMNKRRVILTLVLSIITLFLSIIQPMVIQQLMDQGILNKNVEMLISSFAVLILIAFLQAALTYIVSITHMKVKKDYSYYIKIKIFNHISKLNGSFFSNKRTGELIKVLESDVYTIENAGIDLIIDVVFNVITSIWAIFILWNINYQLLFIVLFIELLIIVTQQYFIKHMYRKVEELRSVSGESMSFTEEFLSNILNLILVKADKIFMRKFKEIEKINIVKTFEYMRYSEGGKQTNQFMNALMVGVVYLISGMFIIKGDMTIGIMIAFLQYVSLVVNPFLLIINSYSQIRNMTVSIQKIYEIFEIPIPETGSRRLNNGDIFIEIKHIDFGYRENEVLLKDLCMKFEPQKVTAIIGESGCGKSTITKLLYGLWKVEKGEIRFNNIDIKELDTDDLRKHIAVVTQDAVMFNDSIKNNISLDRNYSGTEVLDMCEIVQLSDVISDLPSGLEENLGEQGNKLSGGQKQRVALARALLERAEIIILDESTSALDNITQEILMRNITPILKKKTAIIITHRLSAVNEADYVYVLENQQVIEEGTPQFLKENGEKYIKFKLQDA